MTKKECAAGERKVGVYVCHCGGNISDHVDVDEVCQKVKRIPGVTSVKSNLFMCSDPGQKLIMEDLRSAAVDRVVVASCAPSLHEATFRRAVAGAGGNPYIYEHANIREQVSWVHHGPAATQKAIRLIAAATAKAKRLEPLPPIRVGAVKHATVVGGGIAGLKAARDLANRGIEVALIEKSHFLGGRTARLDRLAPSGENAAQVVSQLAAEVLSHRSITVHTCSRVSACQGYIGNFRIGITRDSFALNSDSSGNGQPVGSGIGRDGFIPFLGTYCGREQGTPRESSIDTGVILLATGFKPYEPKSGEYGFREFQEVVTLPELIPMLAQAGQWTGTLELDGRKIKSVAMIHCVGSRMIPGIHQEDEEGRLNEYCSRTCCSATLQAASLMRRTWPQTNVFEFYRDIRTYGRGQEELYTEASRNNVSFLRFDPGEPPVIEKTNDDDGYALLVRVKDQLTFGEELEAPVDLVVLSVGMEPNDVSDLVNMMKLPVGTDRFFQEVHPKLRPVELSVPGILIAGTCQAPMSVEESCAAASAAAVKACAVLSRGFVELDPFVAEVDIEKCKGTGACVEACLKEGALGLVEAVQAGEKVLRANVNATLCIGCGACTAVCPEGAIDVKGWTLSQYEAMVDAIVSEELFGEERSYGTRC
jgi:heterodisulfide reductase subunit A